MECLDAILAKSGFMMDVLVLLSNIANYITYANKLDDRENKLVREHSWINSHLSGMKLEVGIIFNLYMCS